MSRHAMYVMVALLALLTGGLFAERADAAKKIVFVPGRPSHGYGSHEHRAGCLLLADQLNKANIGVTAVVTDGYGYPSDPSVFNDADAVVVYCDGGGGHLLNKPAAEFDKIMKKGVGLVCLHYGVETTDGEAGDYFLKWMGGYFAVNWSVNPHWKANYEKLPEHEITRGVKPFSTNDEWYYHMRFKPNMEGVTPILSDLPPASSLTRKDGPHEGNPEVRKAVLERKEPQHMAWAYERGADYNNGRGFGFTGGHFHWNWANDNQRRLVLNAIVWAAKMEVPSGGVPLTPVTADDVAANQDEKAPGNFNLDTIQNQINEWNGTDTKRSGGKAGPSGAKASKGAKALFSKGVSASTKGRAVDVDVDITGAKQLYLVVGDGGDGFGCDWADWIEPRLVAADGSETKLTDLKWKSASAGFGEVHINKRVDGGPLKVEGDDTPIGYGIGTHANSIIAYDLPAGHKFTKFKARGAVDEGGTSQGCGSTVEFMVFNAAPSVGAISSTAGVAGHDPDEATNTLDVHPDLQVDLFAAEPMLLSPSNTDIDHLGRVWVCEIVNYRRHNGERKEGDRILILEDSDHDGHADKETVFYQGPEVNSAHGVCVLATPDLKGTQAIVSCGDKVWVFTDKDGDGQADDKRVLFSGISGTQHDHGIHQFIFGPDGKLYFNFGNAGQQIKDADGKPIIDKAGNEVNNHRKPYQEGMVFRCNLDGSEFETLGWDFRNNWMVTVDSFGTLWQSDNDDDGNKGVRINYVMEYGNYGYKDEKTGASWQTKRTGMNPNLPWKHWHQNDPGVVPNLLHTGAGSPTGICKYEGDLLPKVFQNQLIHCDAGPNVVRAYALTDDGAGYSAEIVNILEGRRDRWFRPSDVKVAPDGSLIVADWYDPGVGGHNMQDMDRGRLFRVTPKDHSGYSVPKQDFGSIDGLIAALKSPNNATRYVAWQGLAAKGDAARGALTAMSKDSNPVYRARALWLLAKLDPAGAVAAAAGDKDDRIRCQALRMARESDKVDTLDVVAKLVGDSSPQVRRDCSIALRFDGSTKANELWAKLAAQYDGKDRWYLEALGIGSDLHADARFDAWMSLVGDKWNTPAGHEIVWRTRSGGAADYLVKILQDPNTPKDMNDHYMRAFDFLDGAAKDKALKSLLGL